MRITTVAILASDPGTREGAIALLSAHPDIAVLIPEREHEAKVLLVITASVTEHELLAMEHARYASFDGRLRIVMVTDYIDPRQLMRAINAGLVLLLDRRTCGYDKIARSVVAAATAATGWPAYMRAAWAGR